MGGEICGVSGPRGQAHMEAHSFRGVAPETVNHLFCECVFVWRFWREVGRRTGLSTQFQNLEELWVVGRDLKRASQNGRAREISQVIVPAADDIERKKRGHLSGGDCRRVFMRKGFSTCRSRIMHLFGAACGPRPH
ncbi:hypothetical protein QJS10_CPA06g00977 [Acorus calamus]|uniref:Reverse transcriptase zinc-binding domain-containing protein n=1 Tax=Acorus calamus TaxID=4465 RepID=A0AAV9EQE2_ACOCL|nr:hypothetical protein QJS10_CPA06g00977 [Acorus calamus]